MKLIGYKRNGRRVASRKKAAEPYKEPYKKTKNPAAKPEMDAAAARRRKTRVRIMVTVISFAMLAGCLVLFNYVMTSIKPPPVKTSRPISTATPTKTPPPGGEAEPEEGDDLPEGTSPQTEFGRKENQFTFVILGLSGGNTDTIMVANFDAKNYKLDVVSIPRDTLVNVSWNTKKANSLYAYRGVDGVLSGMVDLLGFEVDFYVVVDLKAFSTLVDAIGGVWFDVPKDMKYDDSTQDLHINLKKGYQLLNGDKALQLVRCRNVYADADIGRIATQQDFMKAAAQQILEKQKELNLVELANIFLKYVKTDLTYGNIIWFAKEFYKMDGENIRFATLPANYYDHVNGVSYVTIYPKEWVKMINERLNPFVDDIALNELSILTRDSNGKLYVTNGVWKGNSSWGSGGGSHSGSNGSGGGSGSSGSGGGRGGSGGSGGSGSGGGSTASPSPSPTTSPTTSPSPGGNTGGGGSGGNTGTGGDNAGGNTGGDNTGGETPSPGEDVPPIEDPDDDWGDIINPHPFPDGPPEDWDIDSFD